jgi:heme oxygenase (biliverdin-producing, ferredoxin)
MSKLPLPAALPDPTPGDPPGSAAPARSLSARLREGTRHLHTQAERAGLMPALLRGELPLARYLALLRELLAIYEALEAALQRPEAPAFDAALSRRQALQHDVDCLRRQAGDGTDPGDGGAFDGRLLPPTRAYVAHLRALPTRLLAAHAYVRYLGDLAGGQMLRRIVARTYGLGVDGVRFYEFGGPVAGLSLGLRQVLDALPESDHDAIVDEACAAFRRHVDLFEALAA